MRWIWPTARLVLAVLLLAGAFVVVINPTNLWGVAGGIVVGGVLILLFSFGWVKVALGFGGVVLLVALVSFLGVSISDDFAPMESEPAEFVLEATLIERGETRHWELKTVVTLETSSIDRVLAQAEDGPTGQFKELGGEARADAMATLGRVLESEGFTLSRDRGSSVVAEHSESQAVDPLGYPPDDRLSAVSVLAVEQPFIGSLLVEPNSKSFIRITTDCNAFVDVSPEGKSSCVDGVEVREVSLDQGGSIERVSVRGRVAHPVLRYKAIGFIVGLSFNEVVGWLLGALVAGVAAFQADRMKAWVGRVWDGEDTSGDDKDDKDEDQNEKDG